MNIAQIKSVIERKVRKKDKLDLEIHALRRMKARLRFKEVQVGSVIYWSYALGDCKVLELTDTTIRVRSEKTRYGVVTYDIDNVYISMRIRGNEHG